MDGITTPADVAAIKEKVKLRRQQVLKQRFIIEALLRHTNLVKSFKWEKRWDQKPSHWYRRNSI